MNYIIGECTKKESYIVGDSPSLGKWQTVSGTIKYNSKGLYDSYNKKVLAEAKKYAKEYSFTNLRIITAYYKSVTIKQGIIDWIEYKRTEKSYSFS